MKSQKQMFWEAHLHVASDLHEKMAQMQERAGQRDLAESSRKTALARRIAERNMDAFCRKVPIDAKVGQDSALVMALDFGEWAVKQNLG